jgi:glycine/D-amino acid oxidase-like deaminating enzyme
MAFEGRREEISMAAQPQIIVVGAGVIGASIAWHLVSAGARVTVVDAGEPGGVATPCSFAWINASRNNPEPYWRLRMRSMAEWRRLAAAVPGIQLAWAGALAWDMTGEDRQRFIREQGGWGYGIRPIDRAEAARLEPNLADPPEQALHVAEEGMVEPAIAARSLLADAQRHGASVLQRGVNALRQRNGRVIGIDTASGVMDADEVVLAAGVETATLAASAGVSVPLVPSPGLLVHSRPHAPLLSGLVLSPALHMRQTVQGRIVSATDFGGNDPGPDPEGVAHQVFAKTKVMLRGAEGLSLEFHTVGWRPLPADRFPAIGRGKGVDGLYIAVMHSGITLAPAVGLFAAEELLRGRRDPLLAPYGVVRFG